MLYSNVKYFCADIGVTQSVNKTGVQSLLDTAFWLCTAEQLKV